MDLNHRPSAYETDELPLLHPAENKKARAMPGFILAKESVWDSMGNQYTLRVLKIKFRQDLFSCVSSGDSSRATVAAMGDSFGAAFFVER